MKNVKKQLGKEVCLLFLHAITRCDTTSILYGVGKATALKKFGNVFNFKEQANVFSYHSAVSDVVAIGEKALVSLFGGKPGVGLNNLRFQRNSLKNLQARRLILTHRICPQKQLLFNFTAYTSTYK